MSFSSNELDVQFYSFLMALEDIRCVITGIYLVLPSFLGILSSFDRVFT